jgi:hypothetical protein
MIIETFSCFKHILSTEPFDEYNSFVEQAQQEGVQPKDLHNRDYFLLVYYNGVPGASATFVNGGLYDPRVCRVSDLYISQVFRNNLSIAPTEHRREGFKYAICDLIDNHTDYELSIITANWHRRTKLVSRWYTSFGYTEDPNYYYCVASPKTSKDSWRRIFYRGNLSLLTVDKITHSTYDAMFG